MQIHNGRSIGRSARMGPAIALSVLCLTIAPGHGKAQASASDAAYTCPVSPGARLNITADSIGPLSIRAPLLELLRRCPGARIDTSQAGPDETSPQMKPRVVFPFEGLEVSAVAGGPPTAVDSGLPLRLWILGGSGGQLPRGLPSNATWSQLTAAYGRRGVVWVENSQAQVGFCAARGVVLLFRRADYAQPDVLEAHKFEPLKLQTLQDPILPNARIRAITFGSKRVPCR